MALHLKISPWRSTLKIHSSLCFCSPSLFLSCWVCCLMQSGSSQTLLTPAPTLQNQQNSCHRAVYLSSASDSSVRTWDVWVPQGTARTMLIDWKINKRQFLHLLGHKDCHSRGQSFLKLKKATNLKHRELTVIKLFLQWCQCWKKPEDESRAGGSCRWLW